MVEKIINSINKFNLNLTHKTVLTEAASGNYVVTPIIAALAGAKVFAVTKESRFGTIQEVKDQTYKLAKKFNVENRIYIITEKNMIDYEEIDVVTNTGFVRPIDKNIIDKLSNKCVVPLMWEPWEYRQADLDLEYCNKKGIKIYGTNESDQRLQTMKYIGFTVLHFLLLKKMSPYSSKVLVLGNKHFTDSIVEVLNSNDYILECKNNYNEKVSVNEYNAIVISEHENDILIVGKHEAFINSDELNENQYLIHICGNVDFTGIKSKTNTEDPANFGYMSFTTDYIDSQAVIDLHTAGLKVAEGMLKANNLKLKDVDYKKFMEDNYPALAFENSKYW